MNYPIWYLPEIGGGSLIALIAILHVFVAHFAVGGGLYLIYAEKKGLREKSGPILDFTRYHARFFLLVTMVFGAITGVGIWFIIALANPAATSFLIHNFVFGWAIEWVFFMVEIAAAFVYFYTFGRMDSATHLKVGWLYFIAAWLSLFVINGIIGAMLTPGRWVEDFDFWQGFFNPSFFPSLFFRTFIALLIAACYGYLSAAFTADSVVRERMTRFSAQFGMVAFLAAIPAGLWYLSVLPEPALGLVMGKSPTIQAMLAPTAGGLILLFFIMLCAGIFKPSYNLKPVALTAMLCGLVIMGGFEWVREAARRPYVLNEVMYSNSIFKKDLSAINDNGYLSSALWVAHRQAGTENQREAGHELFIHQCYACHTVNGWNNDIVALTANMSYRALVSYIGRIHQVRYFMPPFAGTDAEAKALAAYIAGTLHGREVDEPPPQPVPGSAISGALLFEEQCSSCHAVEDMTTAMAGQSQAAISGLLGTLNEISEEMEPFAGTDAEREQLAFFLFSLNEPDALADQEMGEPEALEPGMKEVGGFLFEDHCSSCHAVEDMVEPMTGQSQVAIAETLTLLDEITEEMEPFAGTDEEREKLAFFLYTLNNPEISAHGEEESGHTPGLLLFEDNCAACHSPEEIRESLGEKSAAEVVLVLRSLDEISSEMEPFTGSDEEAAQLADFLLTSSPSQSEGAALAVDAGREVYSNHCSMCHGEADIKGKTAAMDRRQLHDILGRLEEIEPAMPPFSGTETERDALADYLFSLQQGVQ